MRTTIDLKAQPQPSTGGWEAYRAAAMAIIEHEKRTHEQPARASNGEASNAKRGS
ncbi:MAG TPA: hypothetical protein VLT91_13040 [Rhizomicrobium sp.]|nr:hypothetical protein [Rhizomicrobium sp.]